MLRFLAHAIAGTLGAGIFYAALPMFFAMGINSLWPFGLDALSASNEIKVFGLVCIAILGPMTAVAVVRSSKRMFFASTDGRPALFGQAGFGLRGERTYKSRALVALSIALLSAVSATLLALLLHQQVVAGPAIAVLYLFLLATAAGLAAVELNDLRRTVRLTLYATDA